MAGEANIPQDCADDVIAVNPGLPPVTGTNCDGTDSDQGNPVVVQGAVDAKLCAEQFPIPVDVSDTEFNVHITGQDAALGVDIQSSVTLTVSGTVNADITSSVDLNVVDVTAPLARKVDGAFQNGAGSIVIPSGVLSFAVTVLDGGADCGDTSDWPTLDGPDFAAPVPMRRGQSISEAADDGHGNTLSGPFTVTVPAGACVNATWVKP